MRGVPRGVAARLRLAAVLARAGGGWGRAAVLAACAAVSTALLLTAQTMLLLPADPPEHLFNLVAEPGLRGGTTLATVLLVLPMLLLVHQAVRLGTSARERRLAALRLAGATPADVRALGAVEVGVPVLAGAVAGLALYAIMRVTLGGTPTPGPVGDGYDGYNGYAGMTSDSGHLALVPTSVTPTWWQLSAVVAVVTLAGVATGWAAGRRVVVSPLGLTRRVRRRPPRPWGLFLPTLGVILAIIGFGSGAGDAAAVLVGAAAVAFLVSVPVVAPWFASRVGRRVQARTSDPATLLAARRLVADPRPAGRAGAAIGAVGIVAGFAAVLAVEVFVGSSSGSSVEGGAGGGVVGGQDPFFAVSFGLLGAVVMLALAAGACTLLVQAVESLLERRRPLAALVAAGTPRPVLRRAQFQEAWLATAPLAAGGTLLGLLAALVLSGPVGGGGSPLHLRWLSVAILTIVITSVAVLGMTRLAVAFATRLVDPWLTRACSAENLRTP